MRRIIDFEREFFKVARNLETKEEVKKEFMAQINRFSDEWISDKLRRDILGLEEQDDD